MQADKDEASSGGSSKESAAVDDEPRTFANILEMKMGAELTIKEREKIYFAADLVQKNYLELRKDQDANLD